MTTASARASGSSNRSLELPVGWIAASAALLLATALSAYLVVKAGPLAPLVPALAVVTWVLVDRPKLCLGLLLTLAILFETKGFGLFSFTGSIYGAVSPIDGLLVALLIGVLLQLARRGGEISWPMPFTVPLLVVVLAVLAGVVTGITGDGDTGQILQGLRRFALLLLIPFLMVNLLRTRRDVRNVVVAAVVLASVKGLLGVVAWMLGEGVPIDGTTLTYYAPTANFLTLLLVLGCLASFLVPVRLPIWIYAGGAFALASFVLSFRRSFWIAGVVGLLVLILVTYGSRGWRLFVPAVATVMAAIWVASVVGGASDTQSPVLKRATSLAPSQLDQNASDRARVDELLNVKEELTRSPVVGLGFGVPWLERHPLPPVPVNQDYTHVAVLWYWLKMGILGLAAYVVLMGAALRGAFRLSRSTRDRVTLVASLAVLAGLVALIVVESTGSFTGVDYRMTILEAGVFGWIAAALNVEKRHADVV